MPQVLSLGAQHVRLLYARNEYPTAFQLLQLPRNLILFICYLTLLKTSLTVPSSYPKTGGHYLHLLFELRFRKSKSLDGDVKGIPAELRTDPLSASWICAIPRWYPLERNLSWSQLVNPGHSPSLRGWGWKAGLCVTVTHCAV